MAATATTQSLPQTIATAIGRGKSRQEVLAILCNSGIPMPHAEAMVEEAVKIHKPTLQQAALKELGAGVLLFLIGLVITVGTYSMASGGGMYVISWGPMAFGAIRAVKGLLKLASA